MMATAFPTPRFAERFECGSRHTADVIRKRFGDVLHDQDDARKNVILVSSSAPPSVKNEIGQLAAESWKHERFGTAELTEFEREQIDFTETNVMHAQACKAIAVGVGIDDWLAQYDTTLSVDEHRARFRELGGGGVTMRDLPMILDGGHL